MTQEGSRMAFMIEVACLYLWLPEILTVKSPGDPQDTGATEAYAENVDITTSNLLTSLFIIHLAISNLTLFHLF